MCRRGDYWKDNEPQSAAADTSYSSLAPDPLNTANSKRAAAIVFLASPKATFITGTTLVVDGGKLAR
jgi:NAD(P)-dependent dehydrogenase (short-subunit alcohol dehydrogenase family)